MYAQHRLYVQQEAYKKDHMCAQLESYWEPTQQKSEIMKH